MVSKVERERAALEQAEQDLAERSKRLAELEKQEAEKALARLVRKIGHERACTLLTLAIEITPKKAIDLLENAAPTDLP